jgi:hypothetical protein
MACVVPARRAIVVQGDNSSKPATHSEIRAGGQAARRRVWRCISIVCWDEGGEKKGHEHEHEQTDVLSKLAAT